MEYSIINQYDKSSGITYVYESTSYSFVLAGIQDNNAIVIG
jgi:hypothetical protein